MTGNTPMTKRKPAFLDDLPMKRIGVPLCIFFQSCLGLGGSAIPPPKKHIFSYASKVGGDPGCWLGHCQQRASARVKLHGMNGGHPFHDTDPNVHTQGGPKRWWLPMSNHFLTMAHIKQQSEGGVGGSSRVLTQDY